MNTPKMILLSLVAGALLGGCGDDSSAQTETASAYPYKPGETSVVGQESPKEFASPTGAGCLKDTSGACVDLTKSCGPTDKVDVVVDKSGVVIDVICYPTSQAPVSSAESRPPTGRTYANHEVVVLDDADDGADIKGDVDIDSNGVTLWGNGPAVSLIEGNVTVSKNDGIVRGVRIKGNVTLSGNNVTLLLCVVEGDVTITGNNNVLASCDVHGKVTVSGQNDAAVNNRIQGGIEGKGNLTCDNNVSFSDKNKDLVIDAGEVGAPLTCGGGKK